MTGAYKREVAFDSSRFTVISYTMVLYTCVHMAKGYCCQECCAYQSMSVGAVAVRQEPFQLGDVAHHCCLMDQFGRQLLMLFAFASLPSHVPRGETKATAC